LGLQLQVLQIRGADELEGAFDVAKKQGAGALLEAQATSLVPYQSRIIDLAAKNRLPTMYYNQRSVELGGLMSYGLEPFLEDRRVASMVDKILEGTKPADIPVERPMEFELVINLKTAKQLGLTIPPDVLAWADKVIK
jgi:putative ABC transport system substrate-binding protein